MAKNETITRGYRNNNPLNIRHNKSFAWRGEQLCDNDGFARFSSVIFGMRAAICIIRSYNYKYRIYSVRDIIYRFAPPSENHTEQYISYVCAKTGFRPETRIAYNSEECLTLLKTMAIYESKMDLSLDKWKEAYLEVFRS